MKKFTTALCLALAGCTCMAKTTREMDAENEARKQAVTTATRQIYSTCERYGKFLEVVWQHRAFPLPKKPERLLDADANYGMIFQRDVNHARSAPHSERANSVYSAGDGEIAIIGAKAPCFSIRNPEAFDHSSGSTTVKPGVPLFRDWFNKELFNAIVEDYEWNVRNAATGLELR